MTRTRNSATPFPAADAAHASSAKARKSTYWSPVNEGTFESWAVRHRLAGWATNADAVRPSFGKEEQPHLFGREQDAKTFLTTLLAIGRTDLVPSYDRDEYRIITMVTMTDNYFGDNIDGG